MELSSKLSILALTLSLLFCYPTWFNALISVAVFFMFRLVVMWMMDPYGSFHLQLNDGSEFKTEWLNMGYWEGNARFPDACEALAEEVISAAHCKEGGRVLDVGHACGDSLLLHLRGRRIPTPSFLCGITSLSLQHQRALQRIKSYNKTARQPETVFLYQGDAVFRSYSHNHPLDPNSKGPEFTSITAIDCAYHFRTRADFLRQSYRKLASGGYIALADLFTEDSLFDLHLHILCILLGIPKGNLWDRKRYLRELEMAGFVECEMRDISDKVFPGFRIYLRSRKGIWSLLEKYVIGMFVSRGGRMAIVSARKP